MSTLVNLVSLAQLQQIAAAGGLAGTLQAVAGTNAAAGGILALGNNLFAAPSLARGTKRFGDGRVFTAMLNDAERRERQEGAGAELRLSFPDRSGSAERRPADFEVFAAGSDEALVGPVPAAPRPPSVIVDELGREVRPEPPTVPPKKGTFRIIIEDGERRTPLKLDGKIRKIAEDHLNDALQTILDENETTPPKAEQMRIHLGCLISGKLAAPVELRRKVIKLLTHSLAAAKAYAERCLNANKDVPETDTFANIPSLDELEAQFPTRRHVFASIGETLALHVSLLRLMEANVEAMERAEQVRPDIFGKDAQQKVDRWRAALTEAIRHEPDAETAQETRDTLHGSVEVARILIEGVVDGIFPKQIIKIRDPKRIKIPTPETAQDPDKRYADLRMKGEDYVISPEFRSALNDVPAAMTDLHKAEVAELNSFIRAYRTFIDMRSAAFIRMNAGRQHPGNTAIKAMQVFRAAHLAKFMQDIGFGLEDEANFLVTHVKDLHRENKHREAHALLDWAKRLYGHVLTMRELRDEVDGSLLIVGELQAAEAFRNMARGFIASREIEKLRSLRRRVNDKLRRTDKRHEEITATLANLDKLVRATLMSQLEALRVDLASPEADFPNVNKLPTLDKLVEFALGADRTSLDDTLAEFLHKLGLQLTGDKGVRSLPQPHGGQELPTPRARLKGGSSTRRVPDFGGEGPLRAKKLEAKMAQTLAEVAGESGAEKPAQDTGSQGQ